MGCCVMRCWGAAENKRRKKKMRAGGQKVRVDERDPMVKKFPRIEMESQCSVLKLAGRLVGW